MTVRVIFRVLRSGAFALGLLTGLFGSGSLWAVYGPAVSARGQSEESGVLVGVVGAAFGGGKAIPLTAITPSYTPEMHAVDEYLAQLFGGTGAVAAGSGFEPTSLDDRYPFYRGDYVGENGHVCLGHLSWAVHLYGSEDGLRDTDIYVPAGYKWRSAQPGPTDGAVVFYYPKFALLGPVTLVVFHVRDFCIKREGARVRIGMTGGRGGSGAAYRHAHIEAYRGDVGLPPIELRMNLRVKPRLWVDSLLAKKD